MYPEFGIHICESGVQMDASLYFTGGIHFICLKLFLSQFFKYYAVYIKNSLIIR